MPSRSQVTLPAELIAEVDRLVGVQQRSHFVEEAIRKHVEHRRLGTMLREAAGSLSSEYAEWTSPEAVSAWVAEMRREDDVRSGSPSEP